MPLPMRKVEPTLVGRGNLPDKFKIQNDLEAHANGTLSNIILQLSSLSHHAEEIFTDLVKTATDITTRTAKLQSRIDRLTEKLPLLDSQDEHSLYDCANTKPFQSSTSSDQQVVGRCTIPIAMLKILESCDRPPPLEKLNPYRDDGKDGLKFYTDPNYFFELWRHEMLNAPEKAVRKPQKPRKDGAQRNKKNLRQLVSTREKHRNEAVKKGEVIMSPTSILSSSDTSHRLDCGDGVVYLPQVHEKRSRPTSVEIKHVSFEGIDDDKRKSGSYSDHRLHINGYSSPTINHSFADENALFEKAYELNSMGASGCSLPSPSTTCDSGIGSSLSNGKDLLDDIQYTNGFIETQKNSPPANCSKPRRASQASQNSLNNIIRSSLNGYARPSQPPPAPPPTLVQAKNNRSLSNAGTPTGRASRTSVRDTLPPPPPPPSDSTGASNGSYPPPPQDTEMQLKAQNTRGGGCEDIDDNDDLPPPPPTPDQYHLDQAMDLPQPPSALKAVNERDDTLPPTPPPPPMGPPAPPMPPADVGNDGNITKSRPQAKAYIPPAVDGRTQLMEAIRGGTFRLRKVEEKKEASREKLPSAMDSVAEILARRKAFEMSDSDSSESTEEYDSEGWDETDA